MKYTELIIYNWKAIIRHPLFELNAYFKIVTTVITLLVFVFIFFSGSFLNQIINFLITNKNDDYLKVFSYALVISIIVDFILKFFLVKEDFIFTPIRRFPNSKKTISVYLIAKEIFSYWNFYLVIFFFNYILKYIYPAYSIIISISSLSIVLLAQLATTQLIYIINKQTHKYICFLLCIVIYLSISYSLHRMGIFNTYPVFPYFTLGALIVFTSFLFRENYIKNKYSETINAMNYNINPWKKEKLYQSNLVNYISLNIKMLFRTPKFQRQIISYIVIIFLYLYLYTKLDYLIETSFILKIIYITLISTLFSLTFNQYLFSAEASFFDHLMLIPNFKIILISKYILYMCVSIIQAGILFFLMPLEPTSINVFISTLLYALGPITLLSFSSILVADTKIELFSPSKKTIESPPFGQTLIILSVYTIAISFIIILSLISKFYATLFMFIIGLFSIVISKKWFHFLYRRFYLNRYEKVEKFREQ